MQEVQKVLHHALEIGVAHIRLNMRPGGVMPRAVEQDAQHAGFAGRGFRSGIGLKNMGQLEEPQPLRALGQVVAQILKQARGQSRAQGVLLRRKGIHDGNAALAGQAQLVQILVAHKTVVDRLVEAQARAPVLEPQPEGIAGLRSAARARSRCTGRQHRRDGVQPVPRGPLPQ